MIPLQHQALIAFSKNNKFDATNVSIMNVLFEMDGCRDRMIAELDDYNCTIKEFRRRLLNDGFVLDEDLWIKITELRERIETILFDQFRYDMSDEARNHPEWKEYFHALYSYFVVALEKKVSLDELRNAKSACDVYRVLKRPGSNPPGPISHMIDRLFISLKIEYKKLPDVELLANNRLVENIAVAKEAIRIENARDILSDELEAYDDVIAWSLL
jgi:hypothetical protein